MSYCRWSSEGGWCDVYVYESDRGYETHVASRRRVDLDQIPQLTVELLAAGRAKEFEARYRARRAYLDAHGGDEYWQDIGLPHDGESFCDCSPAVCADRLEALRQVGYHVPQYAIDALREDAEAEDE